MSSEFWPLLVQMIFAVGFASVIMIAAHLIRPRLKKMSNPNPDTFECGVPYQGDARGMFHVKFYLVAMIFIIFDIEAVFLFPWAVTFERFKQAGYGGFLLIEMFIFLFVLLLGYFYVLKKGGLDWESPE